MSSFNTVDEILDFAIKKKRPLTTFTRVLPPRPRPG